MKLNRMGWVLAAGPPLEELEEELDEELEDELDEEPPVAPVGAGATGVTL